MQKKSFKFFLIALFCAAFAMYGLKGSPAHANSGGPPTRLTGAPGEQNCTQCHAGAAVNSGGGTLAFSGLPATYTPNQEITVTLTITQNGRRRFGFQATVLDDQGRKAGDITLTESNRTTLGNGTVLNNLRQYINHTFDGTESVNQNTWTFRWKAPAQSVGRVTFYAAGNAANNNGSDGGDLIYTTSTSMQPGATLGAFTSVSAASFSQTSTAAAEAILAGFGTGLSQNVVVASTNPLPTELDGTEVEVRDITSTTRKAGLFFVSSGQINYLVPAGTINGAATITVKRSGTSVAEGTITVDTAGPGLFSANADGMGVPAAVLFRRRNNVDTNEPVAQLNSQTNRFDPIPLDLGPEGDIVALIVFGTGFRNAAQATATATIGGTAAQVLFAGSQGALAGLDQANILIPRSLIGRGLVDVVFSIGGKTANTVRVNIR